MATKIVSDDINIQLCSIDQKNPGVCHPFDCNNLHICSEYFLNNKCPQFTSNGKCSHSHSLFTRHNLRILEKYKLSATDEKTLGIVSQCIQNSRLKLSTRFERSSLSNSDRDVDLTNGQTSLINSGLGRVRHSLHGTTIASKLSQEPSRTLLNNQSSRSTSNSFSGRFSSDDQPLSTNEKTFSISQRFLPSTNADLSKSMEANTTTFSSRSRHDRIGHNIDTTMNQFDQQMSTKPSLSSRRSINTVEREENDNFSKSARSLLMVDERADSPPLAATAARDDYSTMQSVPRDYRTTKKISPSTRNSNDSVSSRTRMKYVYNKRLEDDQLCYLLGPGRRHIIEQGRYQILPSGYCRLANTEEEKQIEQRLHVLLPPILKTDSVKFTNDDLALLISTSAAERLFEQIQMDYAVISETCVVQFSIELIYPTTGSRIRSASAPSRRGLSARSSVEQDKPQISSSDGKFRIPITNSSIDVIEGDISQTPVDMMVCVSSSYTLLNSVLSKAGPSIASQYKRESRLKSEILLDGGSTLARKILFVTWEFNVESSNKRKAQKSLSDLVKWCIEQASRSNMRSISFPSIGTGQIGLDPSAVCEAMINAASECLDQYKIDVLFVVYPSSETASNQQSYQVFRDYLDNLCISVKSTKGEKSSATALAQPSRIADDRRVYMRRNGECKRISTVTDSSVSIQYHKLLVKSLEKLIVEKTYDLSLVQTAFIKNVDLLIDACLNYHVLPLIDFVKERLTLRGDRDSCSQCFANLRQQRLIHKYSIHDQHGQKSTEIEMNTYTSLKIDEAFANRESSIRIEDNTKLIFDIDLGNFEVHINSNPQTDTLCRKQINSSSKIVPPSSWSSSLLMIRTVEISCSLFDTLECFDAFQQTMPRSDWKIERIEGIENWPLFVHYAKKKSKDEMLVFHGCPFSSVQSIIHYGLHSNNTDQLEKSICLTRDALDSHILGTRRSTDGKHYIFAVRLSKSITDQDLIHISNSDAHLALPIYLIVYQKR